MNTSQLVRYSFLAFLFLLPFQTVYLLREPFIGGEKWQYGTIGVYGTDLLLLVILIGATITSIYKSSDIQTRIKVASITTHRSPLILFLLWSGLSILWAVDMWLAFSSFVTLLLAVGLFFLVRFLPVPDIKKVVFILLCAGVIQSGIGIGQFLYQKSIDSSILGMNAYQASEAGSSVLKIDSGRFLRAYGTFSHPNILGLYLGVILILGIAYFVFCLSYEERREKGFHFSFFLSLITYPASLIVIFLGLILTFSRSACAGVLLGMITIGVSAFLQKEQAIKIQLLKILFVLVLSSLVFGNILFEQIIPRFDTVTIEREGSITERVQSLRDASTIIGEGNILLGTGIGNFTAEMIRLQPGRSVWNIQPAHNVFVLIFAELGVVGIILFLGFFGGILWRVIPLLNPPLGKGRREEIKKENLLFILALVVIIPSLFLDHFLWSSHFGLLFFFLLLGLVSRR